jgi:hypothetical protein
MLKGPGFGKLKKMIADIASSKKEIPEALKKGAKAVKSMSDKAISSKVSPVGKPWAPGKNGPVLDWVKTSLIVSTDGFKIVESSHPYAKFHNTGARKGLKIATKKLILKGKYKGMNKTKFKLTWKLPKRAILPRGLPKPWKLSLEQAFKNGLQLWRR